MVYKWRVVFIVHFEMANRAVTEGLRRYIMTTEKHTLSVQKILEFMRNGADPNMRCSSMSVGGSRPGQTLLMFLSIWGAFVRPGRLYDEILGLFEYLLRKPEIELNVRDEQRSMLIHHVVQMPYPIFLELLLRDVSVHANVGVVDGDGLSPLHIACLYNHIPLESIEHLLRAGVNPFMPTQGERRTPLHNAIISYYAIPNEFRLTRILRRFLEYRVDLGDAKYRDNVGRTFMHYAADFVGDKTICAILLENGGGRSLGVRDLSHKTPLEVAIDRGNAGAIAAIEEYKVRVAHG